MKAIRITILILAIFAVLLAVLVFWPANDGDIIAVMDQKSIKEDGTQSYVTGTVTNTSNKPAFGVEWIIDVYAPDGTAIGSMVQKKTIMWPGQEYKFEVFITHGVASEQTDFEISVEGYILK